MWRAKTSQVLCVCVYTYTETHANAVYTVFYGFGGQIFPQWSIAYLLSNTMDPNLPWSLLFHSLGDLSDEQLRSLSD